eukprot:scaffold13012_cov20-Tisochrysis_lutea.AAC.1
MKSSMVSSNSGYGKRVSLAFVPGEGPRRWLHCHLVVVVVVVLVVDCVCVYVCVVPAECPRCVCAICVCVHLCQRGGPDAG